MKEIGYLRVDDNHSLYYEREGNILAPTVLFLHGGPGLGFSDKDKSFFDFESCNVIFFDQRGSGRSRAIESLKNNTTQDLIIDINFIYEYFNLKEAILFGGSWGSTLALAFAIKYPERVKSMIMRGLFRGSLSDRQYYERGKIKELFPAEWARVKEVSGVSHDDRVMLKLYEDILHTENQETKRKAFELILFGVSINNLGFENSLIEEVSGIDYYKKAKILSHYAINDLFLENNYIDNNKEIIAAKPIHLIHGNKDFICPVDIAYDFARNLENGVLIITEEGHSPYTPKNHQHLKKAIKTHL